MTHKKDHSDKFIKLEKLSKESVFTTPEGYFEQLPGIIQQKAVETDKNQQWIFELPVFY